MNIDLLIKMANEIGEFFHGATTPEQAPRDVATHLKRYWEPRMLKQIVTYYEQRHGAGLSDLAKQAVGILHTESKAAPAGAAAGSAPAPGAKP